MSISTENQEVKNNKIINSKFIGFKVNSIIVKLTNSNIKQVRRFAICECDCKEVFEIRTDRLKDIKSCHKCALKIWANRKIIPDYGSAKLIYFNSYKHNAKNRDLEFSLTQEEFNNLISLNCHYCNTPPKDANYLSKSTKKYGGFTANGIDRMNNSIGYTVDNSLSCCTVCNMMKKVLKYNVFLEHIEKIYKYKIKND